MIARYTLPEMGRIWSEENKYKVWLEVELLACEAQSRLGLVPAEALQEIRSRARFSIDRILEIEETVKHDVIAFLTNVAEHVGPASRYIHLGMTSSDLLDTALGYRCRQAGMLLLKKLRRLQEVVGRRAIEFRDTPCVGRTHGIHAEPMTFGLKLALWYDELGRCEQRLQAATDRVSVGKISGSVGTFAHIDPSVEAFVCEKLGLKPAPVSTQIVQRDRHAELIATIALVGASLEKFATEIRNLQRTDLLEVEEYFSKGQKGSSAMPHKRNPITCERIAGLARLLRGHALAALENVNLWHERDITHSSVERVILPDSTITLDYMLAKFSDVVDRLLVYPENMLKNLNATRGLVFSQSLLLALVRSGLTREESYALVQRNAMQAWQSQSDFKSIVQKDSEIVERLGQEGIEACFDLSVNLRRVPAIFERIGLRS